MEGNTFGEWLNAAMAKKDISGVKLAALVGISQTTINKWRNGDAPASLKAMERVKAKLDAMPDAEPREKFLWKKPAVVRKQEKPRPQVPERCPFCGARPAVVNTSIFKDDFSGMFKCNCGAEIVFPVWKHDRDNMIAVYNQRFDMVTKTASLEDILPVIAEMLADAAPEDGLLTVPEIIDALEANAETFAKILVGVSNS